MDVYCVGYHDANKYLFIMIIVNYEAKGFLVGDDYLMNVWWWIWWWFDEDLNDNDLSMMLSAYMQSDNVFDDERMYAKWWC